MAENRAPEAHAGPAPMPTADAMTSALRHSMEELAATVRRTLDEQLPAITEAARLVLATIERRGTLFFCGNGGSAADAQHLAAEYVVRFVVERRAYPAIALTTDTSALTAAANDFGYDTVFARQLEALAKPGDLLIIHSTSGNSPSVLRAAETARARGVRVLALTAKGGGELATRADQNIIVPTDRTDRAQEIHICIQHAICALAEQMLAR